MKEEFVSEPIQPLAGTTDPSAMARGEPGLPRTFIWRGCECTVAEVLESWKQSGPCKSGSKEKYLRKHWFRLRTTAGLEMSVYFERQPRAKGQAKARWWLYTLAKPE